MAQETIAVGAAPNDGTGDPIRVAFGKANSNFAELFERVAALEARIAEGVIELEDDE